MSTRIRPPVRMEHTPQLVAAIQATQMLSAQQLSALRHSLAGVSDPVEAARRILAYGWLTEYQLEQLLAGQGPRLVHGPYEILEPLTDSKSGRTFKARHKAMNRIVALKVLDRRDFVNRADSRDAFHRHTQRAAQLLHPNIITTYDAAFTERAAYIAIEFFDAPNLQTVIARTGPLPIPRVLAVAHQLLGAFEHAHQKQVLHGQINPTQILYRATADGEPQIKVLNLGLGPLVRSVAGTGTRQLNAALAAVDYAAPEELAGDEDITPQADWYSLGCVLYYLLAGEPPRGMGGELHQFAGLVPITHLRADVPPQLVELISRLTAHAPQDRPTAASQCRRGLEELTMTALPASEPMVSPFQDLIEPAPPRTPASCQSSGATGLWHLLVVVVVIAWSAALIGLVVRAMIR